MEEKRNELFEDMVVLLNHKLQEFGVSDKSSPLIANALADHLADHWGGQNLSIPKDYQRKLVAREMEIYGLFTGDNYDLLAKKYGMTERGIRKLLNRIKARLRRNANGMPQLFDTA